MYKIISNRGNNMTAKNIISLTTFPARINTVHLVIKTLLAQTVPADKVVLWLASEQFPKREQELPQSLLELTHQGLEIKWCPDIKSYKKLIPALEIFPTDNIITADDDIIYPNDFLEQLLETHKHYPKDIIAHRVRKIAVRKNQILPYKKWRLSETRGIFNFAFRGGYNNLLGGGGGVLYPPKSLDSNVFDSEKFMTLCKHQDDVWFWAMAVKNNRKIIPTKRGYNLRKRTNEEVQSVGLWQSVNSKSDSPNNTAINNILNAYPEIKSKLKIR